MDTLFVLKESTAAALNKVASECEPCVNGSGTNLLDVIIVAVVCLTIAVIAIYGILRYYRFKDVEKRSIPSESTEKFYQDWLNREAKSKAELTTELEEFKKKNKSDSDKRKIELQDRMLKLQLDMQDKLLNYIKENVVEESKNDNGDTVKKHREKFEDVYTMELRKAIEETKQLYNDIIGKDGKEA